MKKLYSLVNTTEQTKKNLYVKGVYEKDTLDLLHMRRGERADFTTYFNSFSVKKWKRYTTLTEVTLKLQGQGNFAVTFEQLLPGGNIIKIPAVMKEGAFAYTFSRQKLSGDILGFSLKCLSEEGTIAEGAWYGTFENWQEKSIGVSITTFKREAYVQKTISVLQDFHKQHSWLNILVVDNGRTLEPVQTSTFRIVHNRNFGGSGGFTRGMIEYVEQGKVDYVLLMDDDIVLEPSAIERTHSLLCGLKETYEDSFLSGAMLRMENPTMQHENTAYWNRIISIVCHQNLDLSECENLVSNEQINTHKNAYAGWWYCCIPVKRINEIGYPLPVFIKADDMEFGIRNQRKIIHMNGIGVWHEIFNKKMSTVIRYYSDRNSFILNHYAFGCNKLTLLLSIVMRLIKRGIHHDKMSVYALLLALKDYNSGFYEITKSPSDQKMQELLELLNQPVPQSLVHELYSETKKAMQGYNKAHKLYLLFRKEKLKDSQFWCTFMK